MSLVMRARHRLRATLAHLPVLAFKEPLYRADFYAFGDAPDGPMYDRLADVLVDVFEPRSAVDVGCGMGRVLSCLAESGVEVRGIEGSRHAIAMSQVGDRIVRRNLECRVPRLGRLDLALCIEVAEQPARTRCGQARRRPHCAQQRHRFSAATPGQRGGGTHHVNEQPHEYWLSRFEQRGFGRSAATETVRAGIADIEEPSWMHNNLLVLGRG